MATRIPTGDGPGGVRGLVEDYVEFWRTKGLANIAPSVPEPEGFDVGCLLAEVCTGQVLEVGCGIGRLAKHFRRERYSGVDINEKAVARARLEHPGHDFYAMAVSDDLERADTVLLYTVCLHIPDALIGEHLTRCAAAARRRVVIAEIMEPIYRRQGPSYVSANHRDAATYAAIMKKLGWRVIDRRSPIYRHYSRPFTVMTFEACKTNPSSS